MQYIWFSFCLLKHNFIASFTVLGGGGQWVIVDKKCLIESPVAFQKSTFYLFTTVNTNIIESVSYLRSSRIIHKVLPHYFSLFRSLYYLSPSLSLVRNFWENYDIFLIKAMLQAADWLIAWLKPSPWECCQFTDEKRKVIISIQKNNLCVHESSILKHKVVVLKIYQNQVKNWTTINFCVSNLNDFKLKEPAKIIFKLNKTRSYNISIDSIFILSVIS